LAGRSVHRLSSNTSKSKKPGGTQSYLPEYHPILFHAKWKYGLKINEQYLHRVTVMCTQLSDLTAASVINTHHFDLV
jgi:hypothetical protein